MLDTCVVDLIAADLDGMGAPQLMVMMTPAALKPGENLTFPPIPVELERRFKATSAQLQAQAAAAQSEENHEIAK